MSTQKLDHTVSSEDHVRGNPAGSITLLEYGDFQCPFCGLAYPVVKKLEEHFKQDLRFAFRNFPLFQSHRYAVTAAVAAEAAGLQGKFWEMHDILYTHQNNLTGEDLLQYATDLDLDLEKFDEAMRSKSTLERVQNDFLSGEKSGVDGTPSFYINDIKYVGAYEFEDMKRYIERLQKPSTYQTQY